MAPSADKALPRLPHRVAVIGAAGGLGQGILRVCRAEGIAFTAIVRSRPERIVDVPQGSQVAVVTSLADRAALTKAFSGADVVLTALGVTLTSNERSAMLSKDGRAYVYGYTRLLSDLYLVRDCNRNIAEWPNRFRPATA